MIRERAANVAYLMVRNKFIAAHKKRALRQENRPNSFSYQTGWARGTISLTKEASGTRIAGNAERQMSIIFMSVLALIVGIIAYGLWGAFMLLGLVLFISLPIDAWHGGKKRRAIGPQLCKSLHGTAFEQH